MIKVDRVEIQSALWVAAFAYFGVGIRILLSYLARLANGALISTIGVTFFLPNILGTFALGLSTASQTLLPKSWQSISKGFNTGFCGSLTTFSTWQLAVGLEALDGRWLDSITKSALVFTTSYLALLAGIQLGKLLTNVLSARHSKIAVAESSVLFSASNSQIAQVNTSADESGANPAANINAEPVAASKLRWPVTATLFVTASVWLLFAVDIPRRHVWLAMAFGPFGALLRHLLSFGNLKTPNFPVFTLIANEMATTVNILITIVFNVIQSSSSSSGMAAFELWVRNGLSTGCMGSLSTVSTWVNELHKLSWTKSLLFAYRYGLATVVVAQVIVIGLGTAYVIIAQKSIVV